MLCAPVVSVEVDAVTVVVLSFTAWICVVPSKNVMVPIGEAGPPVSVALSDTVPPRVTVVGVAVSATCVEAAGVVLEEHPRTAAEQTRRAAAMADVQRWAMVWFILPPKLSKRILGMTGGPSQRAKQAELLEKACFGCVSSVLK